MILVYRKTGVITGFTQHHRSRWISGAAYLLKTGAILGMETSGMIAPTNGPLEDNRR